MRCSLESCVYCRYSRQGSTCSAPRRRAAATLREPGDDFAWVNQVWRSKCSEGDLNIYKCKMAIVDGNLVLCLPACKMALKAIDCPECQYRSCMAFG